MPRKVRRNKKIKNQSLRTIKSIVVSDIYESLNSFLINRHFQIVLIDSNILIPLYKHEFKKVKMED